MAAMDRHSLTLDPMGIYIFVNSSETPEPILTKLYWNLHWMVLYKICVRFCRAPTNMAAMARHSLTLDPLGILHFRQLL